MEAKRQEGEVTARRRGEGGGSGGPGLGVTTAGRPEQREWSTTQWVPEENVSQGQLRDSCLKTSERWRCH